MWNPVRLVLPIAIATAIVSLAQTPQYVQGPKGGCYEVTKSGGKKSVNRSLCAQGNTASAGGQTAPEGYRSKESTNNYEQRATTFVNIPDSRKQSSEGQSDLRQGAEGRMLLRHSKRP